VPETMSDIRRKRRRDAQPPAANAPAPEPAPSFARSPAPPSNPRRPARPPSAAPAGPSTPPHHAPARDHKRAPPTAKDVVRAITQLSAHNYNSVEDLSLAAAPCLPARPP
jgi:hypothetical protein